jgi:hypothetical protein
LKNGFLLIVPTSTSRGSPKNAVLEKRRIESVAETAARLSSPKTVGTRHLEKIVAGAARDYA